MAWKIGKIIDMLGNKITGLADGTAASDAATKGQVDSVPRSTGEKATVYSFASTTGSGWTRVAVWAFPKTDNTYGVIECELCIDAGDVSNLNKQGKCVFQVTWRKQGSTDTEKADVCWSSGKPSIYTRIVWTLTTDSTHVYISVWVLLDTYMEVLLRIIYSNAGATSVSYMTPTNQASVSSPKYLSDPPDTALGVYTASATLPTGMPIGSKVTVSNNTSSSFSMYAPSGESLSYPGQQPSSGTMTMPAYTAAWIIKVETSLWKAIY